MLNIIAIDPSLSNTGLAFGPSDASAPSIIESIPTAHLKLTGMDRIAHIVGLAIDSFVATDLVVIETMMLAKQSGGAETAWLHGILRWTVASCQIPYVEISGATRQKFACGNQKDRSKDAVLIACVKAGFDVSNNDEADATWMWAAAAAAYNDPDTLHAYQREALTAIAWPTIGDNVPTSVQRAAKPRAKKRVTK